MPLSDPSETFTQVVWPEPSPAGLLSGAQTGAPEVSRFSCLKFLGVPGVFDYAGPNKGSRFRPCPCCLPHMLAASAPGLYLFAALCPARLFPCLRFAVHLTMPSAKLEADWFATPSL